MNLQISDQLLQTLKPIYTFFHPALMLATLGLAFYAAYLGFKFRLSRKAEGAKKKEMMAAKYNLQHFQVASIFLVVMIFGTIGGMAVTYINNGKLFVGAHLLAGLGLAGLTALSASLSPLMQQGREWARVTHISLNFSIIGIFLWQTLTGFEIVQRILAQMAKAVA
ncbi:MAG: DUF4079 domain-containing protein [Pseudanabaenaceae cyanobacterium bins.68]|nr:DUF4079 domain-containing protein [Pseudanabaenaceae cyanobacterium bins.68]